jgi:hypothetical protein
LVAWRGSKSSSTRHASPLMWLEWSVYLLKVSPQPAYKHLAGACHDWRGCCVVVLSLACRSGEGRKCGG